MAVISVTNQYLSQDQIEECILEFKKERELVNPHIQLDIKKELLGVDILLIGYFILFKAEKQETRIIMNFEIPPAYGVLDFLKRQLIYTTINYGKNVFEIQVPGKTNNWTSTRLTWLDEIKIPTRYLPTFLITEEGFSALFETSAMMSDIVVGLKYSEDNTELYETYQRYVSTKMINEKDSLKQMQWLAQLATYKCLSTIGLLTLHLDEGFRTNKKIGGSLKLGSIRSPQIVASIYERLQDVLVDMLRRPIVHRMLFSLLLETNLISGTVTVNNLNDFINDIKSLWTFNLTLCAGLKELAKNICKHSNPNIGVLTFRIYKGDRWHELKNSTSSSSRPVLENFLTWTKADGSNPMSFLDINVIDSGRIGVIQTLFKKSSDEFSGASNDDLRHDLKIMESGALSLANFVDPGFDPLLNQQAKRATAHLGLLFFSRIISDNRGMFRASTWKFGSIFKRDNVLVPSNIGAADDVALCQFGTSYHIVVPIVKKNAAALKVLDTELNFESTASGLNTFEDFLFVDLTQEISGGQVEKDRILVIQPGTMDSTHIDFESRLWKLIADKELRAKGILEHTTNHICLDLHGVPLDSSQLFRLAGKWESEYPGIPLITFNIETDVFLEMKKINDYYVKKHQQMPYWNDNSIFICYNNSLIASSVEILDDLGNTGKLINKSRFYFTDALWGNSRLKSNYVNRIISKTNFNSTSILLTDVELKELEALKRLKSKALADKTHRFNIFDRSGNLLPFDLFLQSPENNTLFEQNCIALLGKELKN